MVLTQVIVWKDLLSVDLDVKLCPHSLTVRRKLK